MKNTSHTLHDLSHATAERLTRHKPVTRINHWLMAVSVIVLLFTAFLPIQGIKFSWVTTHWIAGFVFTASVVFHIFYALIWQEWRSMWIEWRECSDFFSSLSGSLKALNVTPGKYWVLQKLFHHIITPLGLIVIVTGLFMLFKIDSPLWERNLYLLSEETWGIIYVLHDFASLCFIPMIMIHIYFAFRPEKLHYIRSMIRGWITEEEYRSYHDPEKWVIKQDGNTSKREQQ